MIYNTELLVRRTDKVSPDAIENSIILKRGDVVVACPSPWNWSDAEINNPNWIIIKSDMTMDEAITFISPQNGDPRLEPGLKLRAKGIDLDGLKGILPTAKANKIDTNNNIPIEVSKIDISAKSKIKTKTNPFKI